MGTVQEWVNNELDLPILKNEMKIGLMKYS